MKRKSRLVLPGLFALTVPFLFLSLVSCSKKNDNPVKETIRMFSNLPDRNFGQGKVEQELIDMYMAEHPGVNIEVECLDETAYKTKFKVYCMERMPDIVSVWGQPAFMEEASKAGVFMELNPADYADYGFKKGAFDGFTYDGKLYGLPRNTDMALFFYNQHMFDDYGWTVPSDYNELLALADEINSHAVVPVAMAGSDGWPLVMYLSDVLHSLTGNEYSQVVDYAVKTGDFSDRRIHRALEIFTDTCRRGLFQQNFASNDYGTAQNMFLSYKAAMFYMGSWETSMTINTTYWDEVIPYIRVITMPVIDRKIEQQKNLFSWYGGGYAVSAEAKDKKSVLDFYNFMFKPENLSKIGLENAVGLSAQNESQFISEDMPVCLFQVVKIAESTESFSGSPLNDMGSNSLKKISEVNIKKLALGDMTIDQFLAVMSQACKD